VHPAKLVEMIVAQAFCVQALGAETFYQLHSLSFPRHPRITAGLNTISSFQVLSFLPAVNPDISQASHQTIFITRHSDSLNQHEIWRSYSLVYGAWYLLYAPYLAPCSPKSHR